MPISGNAAQAETGDLTVLASGPQDAWDRIKPACERFSRTQVYLGAGEQARIMKLVVNALVYAFAQTMAEALTLGRKSGLEWGAMLDALAQSTFASPWLKVKAELLKRRDFTPAMTPRLALKDIDLMLACARAQQVAMPMTALTALADEDLRRALESVNGVGEVRIAGGLAREIRVHLRPDRLRALGISVPEVMAALRSQNIESPAGRVERGATETLVRVTGRITDPRQFNDIVVANRSGAPVRLAEVAPGSHVVEVGPGVGSLTVELAAAGAHVLAVELDKRLAPVVASVVPSANAYVAPRSTSVRDGTFCWL